MIDKLNILVLQPDFSQYGSAYYQHQFTEALGRAHRIFRYGKGLEGYDGGHDIEDVLKMCPFDPDVICFAAGWEVENPNVPEFDPHPAIRVSDVDIPTVMVLNKEYKKLDRKFEFIHDNAIRVVFTVHHDYRRWQEQTGVPFVQMPFAVDPALFDDYSERKRYAVGFSGSLHEQWTDVRRRVKERLFLRWPIKAPRYWGIRVLWLEGSRIPGFRLPRGVSYARLINRSKIWLSTPSAIDLVGTRFYEVMAAKTLLFCSRSPAYGGLFEDKVHCVMFDPELGDFDDTLFYYLNHDSEREAIVETAYQHVMRNHTWERRIEQFSNVVRKIVI